MGLNDKIMEFLLDYGWLACIIFLILFVILIGFILQHIDNIGLKNILLNFWEAG